MTRIALGGISLLSPLTGIGQYTSHLTQGLLKEGVAVDLFLGHSWQNADALELQQPSIGSPKKSFFKRALNKLKRQIPGARHTLHSLRQQSFTRGIQKIQDPAIDLYHEPNFIPWVCDRPTVITIHDLSWIRYPETHPHDRVAWLNESILGAIDRANHIITISDFVTQEILHVFGEHLKSRITRVYNGVHDSYQIFDPQLHQESLNKHQLHYQRYFLALGTLEPRKNLKTVIQSYAKLPTAIQKHYPLVIVGHRGWLNNDLDQAISLVPKEFIRILGYLPQEDIPAITAGAKALIYASHYEGFGLPPLEAMACGVPVISSNAAAMQEIIGDTGLIIDSTDVEGFTDAMELIVEDSHLAKHYQKAGLKRAQNFSWQKCAKETLNIYTKLIT